MICMTTGCKVIHVRQCSLKILLDGCYGIDDRHTSHQMPFSSDVTCVDCFYYLSDPAAHKSSGFLLTSIR